MELAIDLRNDHEIGISMGGELTDDRGLRVVWTDDIGLTEAVSGLKVLADGLIFGRDGRDRAAGFVRVMAHQCDWSCYCPIYGCSGGFGVVQMMDELAQTKEHAENQTPQTGRSASWKVHPTFAALPQTASIEEMNTSLALGWDLQLEFASISRAFAALVRHQNTGSVFGLPDLPFCFDESGRTQSHSSIRVNRYL